MEEIIEKIRELMGQVDPAFDVSAGSAFDTVVLQYVRDQFGVEDLTLDIEDMIIRRIEQLDPEILTAEGSPIREFLIKPLTAILQVPRLEIQRIKNNQDLNNFNDMTDLELERRLSNFFVSRRQGDVAVGVVRAFFASPVPVRTNLTNRATTSTGLGYLPDGAFTASQQLVASQKSDGLFFVDIPYVAENRGQQYNVDPGAISAIDNLPGLVRATNVEAFVGGVPREDNTAMLNRALKSLAERSLSSRNSIVTILFERFSNKLLSIIPIGFGDIEMQRDVFTVEPSVLKAGVRIMLIPGGGNATFDLDSPEVDDSSTLFRVFDGTTELTKVASFTGPDQFMFLDNAGPGGVDQIVLDTATAEVVTVLLHDRSAVVDLIRTIPGSIELPPLFPAPDQSQDIHVGGKADIFVKPSTHEVDSVKVLVLGNFTVFKADDGAIYQEPDGSWYFETARRLDLQEMGVLPGDFVELVSEDYLEGQYVRAGESFVAEQLDLANKRIKLAGVPAGFIAVVDRDVRIRIPEARAFPLERLVAVDNQNAAVFLDTSGVNTGEFSTAARPLAPGFGSFNRDISDPAFARTFQTPVPMVATRGSTIFDHEGSPVLYGIGIETGAGEVLYFTAEENIASGSLNRPWTRILDVKILDSLSLEPIADETLASIYPADIRSVDLAGGVDEVNEAAGNVRIYFEKPVTILLYGSDYGAEQTRFVHRVTREVEPGVFVEFNLKYRLITHGPAGSPAVLLLPPDFREENGLWFIELAVQGDHVESERSDAADVTESDLVLGDGAVMVIGDVDLEDDLVHQVGELEFESAGDPSPRLAGNATGGLETPVDSLHPYLLYTGTGWTGGIFTANSSFVSFRTNQIRIGDFLRTLVQAPASYATITTGSVQVPPNDYKYKDPSLNFGPTGVNVKVGDIVTGLTPSPVYVVAISTDTNPNDTLELSSVVTPLGLVTISLWRWVAYSTYPIVDVPSEGTVQVEEPGNEVAPIRFVILNQEGTFRLKNPHIRLSAELLEDGTTGNLPNRSYRAEGFRVEPRNPYDRRLLDRQYTFGVEELSYFRYTEGSNSEYLPNLDPSGSELRLLAERAVVDGRARGNFTFMCGRRVAVKGPGYEFVTGPSVVMYDTFPSATGLAGVSSVAANQPSLPPTFKKNLVDGTLTNDSIDSQHLRALIGSLELRQIPYVPTDLPMTLGFDYMFGKQAGDSAADALFFSADTIAQLGIEVVALSAPASVTFSAGNNFEDAGFDFVAAGVVPGDFLWIRKQGSPPNTGLDIGFFKIAVVGSPPLPNVNQVEVVGTPFVTVGADTTIEYGVIRPNGKRIDIQHLIRLDGIILATGAAPVSLTDGILTVTLPVTPRPAKLVASTINGSAILLYSVLGDQDLEADVPDGSYTRGTAPVNELGENYTSVGLQGRDIEIEYEWSRSARETHEYVVAPSTRSINQDLLVRHGIPVYVNIRMTVNSPFASSQDLEDALRSYILVLDQTDLKTSNLVRLPAIAKHVPIPVSIIGVTVLEDRTLSTYRSDDGIDYRRIEVVLPNDIEVTVTS